MNTETNLNAAIVELTTQIQEKYPELYEHLGEMPVTNPDAEHPDINVRVLKDYYDSLTAMMNKYVLEHTHVIEHKAGEQ